MFTAIIETYTEHSLRDAAQRGRECGEVAIAVNAGAVNNDGETLLPEGPLDADYKQIGRDFESCYGRNISPEEIGEFRDGYTVTIEAYLNGEQTEQSI